MKYCLFIILPAVLFCLNVKAQTTICQNIYVWDFTDENGLQTPVAQQLMQETENALTQLACTVLQRRNYAQITEQVENEKAVQTLEGISGDLDQQLKSIQAETVLFGQAKIDFAGNIILHVSFERLATKEILRSEFLLLRGEDAHNVEKRRTRVQTFIAECIGVKVDPVGSGARPKQIEEIPTTPIYAGMAGVGLLGGGLFIGGAIKASKASRENREVLQPKYQGLVAQDDPAYLQEYEAVNKRYKGGQWLMVGGAAILAGGGYLLFRKLKEAQEYNANGRLRLQPKLDVHSAAAAGGSTVIGMSMTYHF